MNKLLLLTFLTISLFFVVGGTNIAEAKSYGFKAPSYRTYSNGGSLRYQAGYFRKSGTYVQPHFKTSSDNTIYNNRRYILGY
jgi:hypothetical protein